MKAKNPYPVDSHSYHVWDQGHIHGLRAGERRLAKAVKRWSGNLPFDDAITYERLCDWLTARLKRGKK